MPAAKALSAGLVRGTSRFRVPLSNPHHLATKLLNERERERMELLGDRFISLVVTEVIITPK